MSALSKVLVLDDNAFNRALLRDVLEDGGFDTEAVEDLPAFEKALEWWHPDAVVVDLNMPGSSGTDVIRQLKAREGAPPAILLSALSEDALERLAASCGADAAYSTLGGMQGLVEVLRGLLEPPSKDGSPGW